MRRYFSHWQGGPEAQMREYQVKMRYLNGDTRIAYVQASSPEFAKICAAALYAPRAIVAYEVEVRK